MLIMAVGYNDDSPAVKAARGAAFSITDTKLYVPTLSNEDNNKFFVTIV